MYPDYTESNLEFKYLKPVILNRVAFERYLKNKISITESMKTPNSARWVYLKLNTQLADMKYDRHRKHWKLRFNPIKYKLGFIVDDKKYVIKKMTGWAKSGDKSGEGWEPTFEMFKNEIQTKTIIAADGMNSTVGKLARMKNKTRSDEFFKCIQKTITLNKNDRMLLKDSKTMILIFSPKTIPHGYGWVFPRSDRQINVGLGVVANQKLNLNKALKSMCFRYLNLPSEFKSIKTFYANVPMTLPPMEFADYYRKVMLVGDAGNFTLSSFGGGIATSLWTGMMAGTFFDTVWVYKGRTMKHLLPKLDNANNLKEKLYFQDRDNTEKFLRKVKLLFKIHKLFPKFVEKHYGKNLMNYRIE
jgi:flavin-dependent dehydrogenase